MREASFEREFGLLSFRGLPITDEAKLHLGDHSQHSQDHAAHRAASIDGRLKHPEACSFFFQFVHEIEDVPRVPAQSVQLTTMRTSRGEFRTQVPVDLNGPLERWCSRLRAQQ